MFKRTNIAGIFKGDILSIFQTMCIVNKKLKMKLYLIHAWQNEEETRSHGPAPLDPPQAEYHCSFVLLKIVVAFYSRTRRNSRTRTFTPFVRTLESYKFWNYCIENQNFGTYPNQSNLTLPTNLL